MTGEAISNMVLEATSLVASGPLVLVSAWLVRRRRQAFLSEWVRGYAAVWVMLLFDYVNLRTGWAPLMLGSAVSLFFACHFFLRTIARIRALPPTSPWAVILVAVLLFGQSLAGLIELRTVVIVSVLFLAVVVTGLGVAMLQAARVDSPASRWVAAPFFLKATWVFAYPYLARHSLAPVGYWVDGLLHVATGLGMLVFVIERSENQTALVRDGTPGHAFLSIDDAGRLVEWNEGAARLFGFQAGAMVGQRLTVLRPREGAPSDPPADGWLQAMLRAEAGETEVWLARADGRDIWCRTSSARAGGTIDHSQFIVMVHDVTERRSDEARMRSLMTAIEQTPEGIALADAEGRIQYANPGLERITGLRADEMRGRAVAAIGREEGEAAPGDPLYDALADGRPWLGRLTGHRRGGRAAIDEAAVMPIRAGSVVTGFLLRLRDVTDEVALRERLRHSQKLEAFGRLAAGVAHDFGNLMTIVAAQSDALTSENLTGAGRREARRANDRAVERADMLIRQLLAYSRRLAGPPRVVDLHAEIREAMAMLGRVVGEELELVVRPEALRSCVRIDPGQLEQVIVNLVLNARDALEGRGRIVLATADSAANANEVVLTVTDAGPGIEPERLARIFEPFFTTKSTGTGLGLSIVHEIIEEAGGTVSAQSVVGRGTTFRIVLPTSSETLSRSRPSMQDPPSGARGTVLVVEDEEDLLVAMQANLVRTGFDVLAAGSAQQAVELAAAHPERIDLLLTDMTMPGGSGRALAEQLVAARPGLRVLFMSGYSEDAAVREGRSELGAFISKPFVFDTLVRRIEAALSSPGRGDEPAGASAPEASAVGA